MNGRWEDVYGGVSQHSEPVTGMTLFHLCVIEGIDKFSVSYIEITEHLDQNPHLYAWRLDDMVRDLDREITRVLGAR